MKSGLPSVLIACVLCCFIFAGCRKDSSIGSTPAISIRGLSGTIDFGSVTLGQSATRNLTVKAENLNDAVTVSGSDGFMVSADNNLYSAQITLTAAAIGTGKFIYVRFTPTTLGVKSGSITISSQSANTVTIPVRGTGAMQQTYHTFSSERLAYGPGMSQTAIGQYLLPSDLSQVSKINMYVKLRCPGGNCGDWDVYAHVQVEDPASGEWYELGRYITPYGVDNSAAGRGFEIDVTDFKSLLQGAVNLRAFIEVWTQDGWLLSVDFDYVPGVPDYKHSAIARVIQYNENSLDGIIYGEDASAFDLTKTISIPANAQSTSLRTIITGWGEETPLDPNGRSCAEWCFRTHEVVINGANLFAHNLGPLGCASNVVQPQAGNWQSSRAGWCPGMAVPVRTDQFQNNMAGQSFDFEYRLEPWTNDLSSGNPVPHAYYAISTFVVVKSNTVIDKPVVLD